MLDYIKKLITPDMVSFWLPSGQSRAMDLIRSNHGQCYGTHPNVPVLPNLINPSVGWHFDRTDDYVDCGNDASLNWGLNDITIAFFFKNTGNDGVVNDLVSNQQANEKGIRTYIRAAGQLNVQLSDGAGTERNIVGATDIGADDTWHHVAFVLDRDGNGQIYLDGVPDGSAVDISALAATDLTTTDNLYIGQYRGISTPFAGYIALPFIANKGWSVAQIKNFYNATKGLFWPR
ncbi:LamG domain-containing protein [bacterium]|nr:LamG domain-containing protein [bacterium]